MILIRLNNTEFEQDIRPLVLSFYPGEKIKLLQNDELYDDLDAQLLIEIIQKEDYIKISLSKDSPSFLQNIYSSEYTVPLPVEDREYRIIRKNQLKRDLYSFLSEQEKKKLPWGTLTGIRPVKIVTGLMEKGLNEQDIRKTLTDEYFMSTQKQELSIRTAEHEKKLIASLNKEKAFSLYIGIPFCPTTCAYCSFTSYPLLKWQKQVGRYIDCLIKELYSIAELTKGRKPETIYIGGGTPTTLEPIYMDRLLGSMRDIYDLSELKEWTVEAGRPDSITMDKLKVMKEHGVDRISVNPQTMKPETLQIIGRRHTVEQTIEAFNMAREAGFDNINMDLIAGLPAETAADMEHTLKEIKKLDPDSLTVHTLALKRAARLNTNADEYAAFKKQDTELMLDMAFKEALDMGMQPYYLYRQKNMVGNLENVGYARPDKFGIYNILIMEEIQSIYAAGAGAATKLVYTDGRHERTENVKDVGQYMDRIDEMIGRKPDGGLNI